ncbi:hypothetical protein BAY61_32305 (plasmid) [Prauserella marina]|uniref:Uncharacterized protein n=1 Tax=Prauserella marina TaxID=530584 RepID=A0A222W189_9PSEU|nr:hypothetical protein [Prauserella marina]ASR39966.1 hypothetical protein BAY61_32305 [Prauserella marina]PWV71303.1 hypothetical protein DES30_11219 [Prauserella marina]SDD96970.1 hypothetical protein SAMN05421630_11593 [Prauserella marina]
MSPPVTLPSDDVVLKAVQEVTDQSRDLGKRPSVLAVARRLGLSNTTFRRSFPDIARQIGDARRNGTAPAAGAAADERQLSLHERNAKLRRSNTELSDHLELAIANIMRLTLENKRLREELEAASKVTRIGHPARSQAEQPPPT